MESIPVQQGFPTFAFCICTSLVRVMCFCTCELQARRPAQERALTSSQTRPTAGNAARAAQRGQRVRRASVQEVGVGVV